MQGTGTDIEQTREGGPGMEHSVNEQEMVALGWLYIHLLNCNGLSVITILHQSLN